MVKNIIDNCAGKGASKIRLNNQICKGGKVVLKKLYGAIELTMVWKNQMTNLGAKFNVNFLGKKLV